MRLSLRACFDATRWLPPWSTYMYVSPWLPHYTNLWALTPSVDRCAEIRSSAPSWRNQFWQTIWRKVPESKGVWAGSPFSVRFRGGPVPQAIGRLGNERRGRAHFLVSFLHTPVSELAWPTCMTSYVVCWPFLDIYITFNDNMPAGVTPVGPTSVKGAKTPTLLQAGECCDWLNQRTHFMWSCRMNPVVTMLVPINSCVFFFFFFF